MSNNLEERISLNQYALFFCFAITVHNIEEAIWLPNWTQSSYAIQQPVTSTEFHFAVLIITALAYLTAFFFGQFSHSQLAKYTFTGFLGSMIFNTFFPHLLSTIIMQAYAPGLITGLLLIVPINTYILYQLHKKGHIKLKHIFLSTVMVGGILLLLIPVLFKISNIMFIY
ncbi:HXXEE domain-containing protein [Solibacillus sp. FSL R7-0668]|uniref:HXXEE domain-containing protein n=1 Tax=Solibacillus sp. FSL R7-0668 TaxID=2921688 RepID=UPI0030FAC9EE